MTGRRRRSETASGRRVARNGRKSRATAHSNAAGTSPPAERENARLTQSQEARATSATSSVRARRDAMEKAPERGVNARHRRRETARGRRVARRPAATRAAVASSAAATSPPAAQASAPLTQSQERRARAARAADTEATGRHAAAEGRDEGFARKRDFVPRGAEERPAFAKRRTEGGDRPARKFGGSKKYEAKARDSAFEGERIAKAMARAGACSRRDAEQWIAEGRVTVNGRKLSSPAFNVKEGDRIEVDGKPLAERERTRLFLFHKPPGLVTSAKDPQGRDTVFDFIKEREPELPRLMSVGRLDINTQGLLLMSNDGGLARALELPATGWKRRYRVRAHGETDQAALDRLAQGVEIEGVAYAPIEAKIERQQGSNVWIAMTLSEGKNREVKRVLAHLGLEVTRLIRVSFGPFQLGELDEGSIEEVRLKVLREQLGKSIAEFAGVDFSSPLREDATPAKLQQARAAAASRPRKHVSVLRREREEHDAEKPRTRIERATTADRKGRAVQIERVVVKGERPAASSRNARRFAAERRDAEESPRKEGKPPRRPPPSDPKKPR